MGSSQLTQEGGLEGRDVVAPTWLVPETLQALSKAFLSRAGSGLSRCQALLSPDVLITEMALGKRPLSPGLCREGQLGGSTLSLGSSPSLCTQVGLPVEPRF